MKLSFRGALLCFSGLCAFFMLVSCKTTDSATALDKGSEPSEVGDAEAAETPIDLVDADQAQKEDETGQLAEDVEDLDGIESRDSEGLDIHDRLSQLGFSDSFDEETGVLRVLGDGRDLSFTEDSRLATLDGIQFYLDRPFTKERKLLGSLSESDQELLLYWLDQDGTVSTRNIEVIALDPGHGGSENGTKNENLSLLEKDLNLDVCDRLRVHLEVLGFRVVLTRYDDRMVPLDDRGKIANRLKADLFVSVHFNAALNKEAHGLESYFLSPEGQPSTSSEKAGKDAIAYPGNRFDKQNFELAFRLQKELCRVLEREDRGVRKARWRVLKALDCPGVLVECGFLSHGEEALLASTAVYREKVSQALAQAIALYAGKASDS